MPNTSANSSANVQGSGSRSRRRPCGNHSSTAASTTTTPARTSGRLAREGKARSSPPSRIETLRTHAEDLRSQTDHLRTELVVDADLEHRVATIVDSAERLVEPVADELVVARVSGFHPLTWVHAHDAGEDVPAEATLADATGALESARAAMTAPRAEPVADVVALRSRLTARLAAEGKPLAPYPWP